MDGYELSRSNQMTKVTLRILRDFCSELVPHTHAVIVRGSAELELAFYAVVSHVTINVRKYCYKLQIVYKRGALRDSCAIKL